MKLLPLLLLGLVLPAALHSEPVPTPRMAMSWNMTSDPRKWVAQGSKMSRAGFLVEFVPAGDSISTWKEKIAQQIVFSGVPLRNFVDRWKAELLKSDPKTEVTEATEPDESLDLTSTSLAKESLCLRRFFQGPDGIYMLAYFVRPKLKQEATLQVWSDIINQATLTPNPEFTGKVPAGSKLVGRLPLTSAPLRFQEVDFLPRAGNADSHEYTPSGQEDLDHWSDMVTVNYYRTVTTAESLASAANSVLQNYKNSQGRVLGTHSVPRTPDKPAEHFIAVVFVQPGVVEAAFARFKLVEGSGLCAVYSHRVYGDQAFALIKDWLKTNGRSTENALMSWAEIPAAAPLPVLGGSHPADR